MHQYREGKVKSTPMRGVKQYLKPNAYKQLERGSPKVSAGGQTTDDRRRKRKIGSVLSVVRPLSSVVRLAFGEPRDSVPLV